MRQKGTEIVLRNTGDLGTICESSKEQMRKRVLKDKEKRAKKTLLVL